METGNLMDLFEAKDLFYLGFLVVALTVTQYTAWRQGVKVGIEAGVEGTIDSMVRDGYVDYDEKTGEITAKTPK
jgi:hypothetical protein